MAAPSRGPTRRASPTEPPTPAVTPAEAAETAETTPAEATARETAPDTPPSLGDRALAVIARRPLLRVTEREVRIGARAFKTVLLTGVATPLLFLGAMGLGLGGLIDANSGDVEGLTYLAFVTPGILCAASLQTAASDCMWPIMGGLKWMKSYHAAAATPLTPADVYGGYVVWVGCRLAVNATFFVIVAALLGGISSPWGVLAIPAAVAGALAVGAPLAAYSAGRENDVTFPIIFRVRDHAPVPVLGHLLRRRPAAGCHPPARVGLAALARRGAGPGRHHRRHRRPGRRGPHRLPGGVHHRRLAVGHAGLHQAAGVVTAVGLLGPRRTMRVVERNVRSYARMWPAFISGFVEPVLYLFSIGIGVGALVGDLPTPGGQTVSYELFVAPAMLATSAMNGTVFDTTFNFFFKYKYAHTFDGMLATPLGVGDIAWGELTWALLRGLLYSARVPGDDGADGARPVVVGRCWRCRPPGSSGSPSPGRAWA